MLRFTLLLKSEMKSKALKLIGVCMMCLGIVYLLIWIFK